MLIEEFIAQSNSAETVEDLFACYKKTMERLGFDRLIFSLMTDHKSIRRDAGHGIISNYSEDWMKYYVSRQYEVHDPVRRQMFTATNTFSWDDVVRNPAITKTQRVLMQEGAEAGLKDGVGVPLRGPRGALAGIGAASSSGGVEINRDLMSYVYLISQQFYTVFLDLESRRIDDGGGEEVFLTEREQEILKWCACGKTRVEIADGLCLSDHTVSFHLKNALRKLDASNVTLGVLKALHKGLIQI